MSRRSANTAAIAAVLFLLTALTAVHAQAQSSGPSSTPLAKAKRHRSASSPQQAPDRASAPSTPAASAGGGDGKPAGQLGVSVSALTASTGSSSAATVAATAGSSAASQAGSPASAVPAGSIASAGAALAPASAASSADAPAESYPFMEDVGVFLLALAVGAPAALLGVGWFRERKQAAQGPSSPTGVVWWGVALMMAVTSVAYAYVRRDTIGFWDGMVGSWLATLLGIVCGVPVALELERQRRRAEEAVKAKAAKQLRAEVVGLLRNELQRLEDQLKERTDAPNGLPIEPLKTSIWDATRASGNLAAISEPELLQVFSEAYRWVGIIATLEAQRIELLYGNDRKLVGERFASEKLEELIRTFLPPATDWVHHAVSFTASLVPASTQTTQQTLPGHP
jgi:hypothetical protein